MLCQVRVAAAQARVHLCDATLDSILEAANLFETPPTSQKAQEADAAIDLDAVLLEEEASRSNKLNVGVLGSIKTKDESFCYLAQAAALSAAAQRLNSLHAAHISHQEERVAAGRKRTAAAAGLELGEDDEPPLAAVTALSPMLSMHAVPALRHEAFKALNASAGQEPSLLCLAAAAASDVTASALVTRAPLAAPLATSSLRVGPLICGAR